MVVVIVKACVGLDKQHCLRLDRLSTVYTSLRAVGETRQGARVRIQHA